MDGCGCMAPPIVGLLTSFNFYLLCGEAWKARRLMGVWYEMVQAIGARSDDSVGVQDTNQWAGMKRQLPGRRMMSINFRSLTNGVSLAVSSDGKQPGQLDGREDSTFSGIIVTVSSPSTGKRHVQVANVLRRPTFPAQQWYLGDIHHFRNG